MSIMGFRRVTLRTVAFVAQTGELRNSHIIPEFLYKPIYDVKHQLHLRRSGRLVRGKPLQKGIREKLLCDHCEGQLSRNEKYWKEVWFGGMEVLAQKRQHQWHISNLDYTRVRIFFLSLIWRMSVASQDSMWKNVNLGPHEEPIRRMVHEDNPGEPWQYGFLCIVPLFYGKPIVDWLLEPDWVRSEWGRMYRLWVGGCIYLFHISNQRITKPMSDLLIRKDGSLTIYFKDALEIPFIREEAFRISNEI